ncbi:hypothetical protein ABE55_00070 [Bacillus thuringiensis]|uniref:hypothetical protein n=1 Tax=Bacillales TaxID=1385 RepID=UPI000DE4478C|nr:MULTISPECIES: hypothetical protein [Bacillales]MBG9464991.1 hypothetical protein [Bacillus thuringiensis]MDA1786674.1 hypothetical protein [Bacillus cereus]MDA2440810.1 hypothetical protein [Bacillus cereus]MDA2446789.1 hypothetical protein [Bacillus cereus]MDZ4540711.1 hypothetical protein [Bacillus cereus]
MKKFGIILVMSSLLVGCNDFQTDFSDSKIDKVNEPVQQEVKKGRFVIMESFRNIKDTSTMDEFMILKDSQTQCKYIYTFGSRSLDSGGTSVTPVLKADGKPDCD